MNCGSSVIRSDLAARGRADGSGGKAAPALADARGLGQSGGMIAVADIKSGTDLKVWLNEWPRECYADEFGKWPRENAADLVDSSCRVMLIGLTAGVLTSFGLPALAAAAIGGVAFGGKKLAGIGKTLKDAATPDD